MEIVEITGYDRASGEITERTLFQLEETKEQPMGVLVRKQELLHVEKLNRRELYWKRCEGEAMERDYGVWKFSVKEKAKLILSYLGLCGLVSWLFYHSFWAVLPFLAGLPVFLKKSRGKAH